MTYEEAFLSTVQTTVQNAFRDLLSHKHLYQNIKLATGEINRIAEQQHEEALHQHDEDLAIDQHLCPDSPHFEPPKLDDFLTSAEQVLDLEWHPKVPEPRPKRLAVFPAEESAHIRAIEFELPTIRTTCGECKKNEPFNPIRFDLPTTHGFHFTYPSHEQDFVLQYQCQACKRRPVTFLVHRSKDKLILCGREPMEIVTVPSDIPKNHQKHFSAATIAHQSGQHLPAIFMLRVFIEQYWLSFPTVHAAATNTSRYTGDNLGDEYKKLLPNDFKQRFPTLLETYGQLSEAIHKAEADDVTFTEAKGQILKHFKALNAFELDLTKTQPEVETESAP